MAARSYAQVPGAGPGNAVTGGRQPACGGQSRGPCRQPPRRSLPAWPDGSRPADHPAIVRRAGTGIPQAPPYRNAGRRRASGQHAAADGTPAQCNSAVSGNPDSATPAINPPLGLDGYCPVVLSEKQQWVLGDRRFGAIHRGRTYLFAGAEEQRRFFTDPDRYAPAVSGNDVVLAAEQGQPVPGMREHGVFFGNRVYLFSSEATLEKFSRNPTLYANQTWGPSARGPTPAQPSNSPHLLAREAPGHTVG